MKNTNTAGTINRPQNHSRIQGWAEETTQGYIDSVRRYLKLGWTLEEALEETVGKDRCLGYSYRCRVYDTFLGESHQVFSTV